MLHSNHAALLYDCLKWYSQFSDFLFIFDSFFCPVSLPPLAGAFQMDVPRTASEPPAGSQGGCHGTSPQ